MKVLITGGAGMVGSHVANLLSSRGDDVILVDNLSTGRKENIEESNSKVIVYFDSIASSSFFEKLDREIGKVDVIVHTAASYAVATEWTEHVLTNTLGTTHVASYAKKHSARVIYFQTALCYGENPEIQPVPLNYPRQPVASSYAISKTAGEFYLEQSGVDFVTFRLANIVGPRNLSGPLPIFYKRLLESIPCTISNSKRDFVDVRDLASVVIQAVDGKGSGAYHFSSGKDVSILDLFNEVVNVMGIKVKPQFDYQENSAGGPPSILLDPTRTYKDFAMPQLRTLHETVLGAVTYYENFGVTREITHMKNSSNG